MSSPYAPSWGQSRILTQQDRNNGQYPQYTPVVASSGLNSYAGRQYTPPNQWMNDFGNMKISGGITRKYKNKNKKTKKMGGKRKRRGKKSKKNM